MKVSVVIASHERNEALRIVLRCLPPAWHATLVVSHEAERQELLELGRPNTFVHLHPNHPVGAKWQHAVDCARKGRPDLLIITGSDDVLIGDTAMLSLAMQDKDSVGLRQWLAYDGHHHYRMRYQPHVKVPVGCGRVYTRRILEKMNWRIFDTARDRGLDNLGYQNVLRHGGTCPIVDEIPGLQPISIKGPWNMYNPMDKLLASRNMDITPLPAQSLLADYHF